MGTRTKETTEQVDVCDACGKDIPEPVYADEWHRQERFCGMCGKLICNDCTNYHNQTGALGLNSACCPQCWKIGEEARGDLKSLSEQTVRIHTRQRKILDEWRGKCKTAS